MLFSGLRTSRLEILDVSGKYCWDLGTQDLWLLDAVLAARLTRSLPETLLKLRLGGKFEDRHAFSAFCKGLSVSKLQHLTELWLWETRKNTVDMNKVAVTPADSLAFDRMLESLPRMVDLTLEGMVVGLSSVGALCSLGLRSLQLDRLPMSSEDFLKLADAIACKQPPVMTLFVKTWDQSVDTMCAFLRRLQGVELSVLAMPWLTTRDSTLEQKVQILEALATLFERTASLKVVSWIYPNLSISAGSSQPRRYPGFEEAYNALEELQPSEGEAWRRVLRRTQESGVKIPLTIEPKFWSIPFDPGFEWSRFGKPFLENRFWIHTPHRI